MHPEDSETTIETPMRDPGGKFTNPEKEEEQITMGKEEYRLRMLLANSTQFGYTLGKVSGELVGNVGNTVFNPLVQLTRALRFCEKLFGGLSDGITTSTLHVKTELQIKKEKQVEFLKKRLRELETEQEDQVVLTPEAQRELERAANYAGA